MLRFPPARWPGFRCGPTVDIALGDLHAGGGHAFGATAHIAHHIGELPAHLQQGLEQLADLVGAVGDGATAEVALGHGARQLHGLRKRLGHGAHKHQGHAGGERQCCHQCHRHPQQALLQVGDAVVQGLCQVACGLGVEGVQRFDGAGEMVEIVLGRQLEFGGVDHLALQQLKRLRDQALDFLGLAAHRLAKLRVAFQRPVEAAQCFCLQLGDALAQHHQLPLVLRGQLAAPQKPRALRPQNAQFFTQHRGMDQRCLDQRIGV
jgi:hypothetical protein